MDEDIKKHREIIYDFWFVSNRFYYLWAKQHGITDLALFTLFIIYNTEGCIQNTITEKLSVPKQTVCSILDGFQKKGYITKEINPKDKRNRLITLTDKGRELAEPILKEFESLDLKIIKCLTETEIENYVKYHKKLINFMENYFDND